MLAKVEMKLTNSKSGDNTPSPNTPDTSDAPPPLDHAQRARRQQSGSSYKSGVDTPDRFVTHCEGPPAISQRHLVDKLNAAEMEISKKDNEDGQRDNIRSDGNEMRVDGQHMIPSGRNINGTSESGAGAGPSDARRGGRDANGVVSAPSTTTKHKTPRARSQTRRPAPMDRTESKAKAFAFFGQVSHDFTQNRM
jgi:NAD+ kinase